MKEILGMVLVVVVFMGIAAQTGINAGYNKGYEDGLAENPKVITKVEKVTDYIDRVVFKEIPCPPCAGATSNTTGVK